MLDFTVSTDKLYAVVGRFDLQATYNDFSIDIISSLPDNLAFISIYEPGSNPIITNNHFASELFLSFYDVEESWSDTISPLTDEQGLVIFNFIMANSDKQFLVNCEAGISRSAGIALAIEYIFRHTYTYEKWEHFPSKVLSHQRYQPNMTVFNKIIKHL